MRQKSILLTLALFLLNSSCLRTSREIHKEAVGSIVDAQWGIHLYEWLPRSKGGNTIDLLNYPFCKHPSSLTESAQAQLKVIFSNPANFKKLGGEHFPTDA